MSVPVSVESVAGFKDLVNKEWGITDPETLASIFKILAERVHPLAFGDVYRARQQIERLARNLLRSHRSEKDKAQLETIVNTLTKELGSHDYLISRSEARELMLRQVAPDDGKLEGLIWQLYRDFADEMHLGKEYDANVELHSAVAQGQAPPIRVIQRLAVVESTHFTDLCEREVQIIEMNLPIPGFPGRNRSVSTWIDAVWYCGA